jgi:hypothetical protein
VIETDHAYMNTMSEFVRPLTESKQSKEESIKSGVLDFWISSTIKHVDSTKDLPVEVKMASLSKIFVYLFF